MSTTIEETPAVTHLGKLLHFDELAYNRMRKDYDDEILPRIRQIKSLYDSLGLKDEFSQTIFNDLLQNSTRNLETQLENQIDQDLKKIRTPVLKTLALENIGETIRPLQKAINDLKQCFFSNSTKTFATPLDWADITFENSMPAVRDAQVKKKFETRVETEVQAALYDKLLGLQHTWNDLLEFLKTNSRFAIHYGFVIFGNGDGDGLVEISNDNSLLIRTNAINYV